MLITDFRSETEKDISAEYSSLVNKAYNTLQTPLMRAIHLLHLKGEAIEEEQRVDDPEFLMSIMELNEEVKHYKITVYSTLTYFLRLKMLILKINLRI